MPADDTATTAAMARRGDDPARLAVRAAVATAGMTLKQASRALGRNDAYLQQYLYRGTPRRLPEPLRLRRREGEEVVAAGRLVGNVAAAGGGPDGVKWHPHRAVLPFTGRRAKRAKRRFEPRDRVTASHAAKHPRRSALEPEVQMWTQPVLSGEEVHERVADLLWIEGAEPDPHIRGRGEHRRHEPRQAHAVSDIPPPRPDMNPGQHNLCEASRLGLAHTPHHLL